MTGSKKRSSERSAILAALKQQAKDGHYVWDGQSEDDRPATTAELAAARSKALLREAVERDKLVALGRAPAA